MAKAVDCGSTNCTAALAVVAPNPQKTATLASATSKTFKLLCKNLHACLLQAVSELHADRQLDVSFQSEPTVRWIIPLPPIYRNFWQHGKGQVLQLNPESVKEWAVFMPSSS